MPYNDPDPLKDAARQKLIKAVQRGSILRPGLCENCSYECTPHGHHNDYEKPFDIHWLCPDCHKDVHRKHEGIYIPVQLDMDLITKHASKILESI